MVGELRWIKILMIIMVVIMTLNFGNGLFPRKNLYSDEGKLLNENSSEDAGRTKTTIIASNGAINQTSTVYTVPANKVLYLTSAYLMGSINSTAGGWYLELAKGGDVYLSLHIQKKGAAANNAMSQVVSLVYPAPIKITSGAIQISSPGADFVAQAGLNGWLEDA